MATVPYMVYGMITANGDRTESQAYEVEMVDETQGYSHILPGAKGDGSDLRCYGWIRAGEIVVTETTRTEGEE